MSKKKSYIPEKKVKIHIKKGDTVLVLSGDSKGTKAKVLKVMPKEYRAIVEGVNMVKRHVKPTADNPGGIQEKEAPIHISNLMAVGPSGTAGRVRREVIDGKRVRVLKTENKEVID